MDHHLLYIGIAVAVIVLLIAVYCFLRLVISNVNLS